MIDSNTFALEVALVDFSMFFHTKFFRFVSSIALIVLAIVLTATDVFRVSSVVFSGAARVGFICFVGTGFVICNIFYGHRCGCAKDEFYLSMSCWNR